MSELQFYMLLALLLRGLHILPGWTYHYSNANAKLTLTNPKFYPAGVTPAAVYLRYTTPAAWVAVGQASQIIASKTVPAFTVDLLCYRYAPTTRKGPIEQLYAELLEELEELQKHA